MWYHLMVLDFYSISGNTYSTRFSTASEIRVEKPSLEPGFAHSLHHTPLLLVNHLM